QLGPDLRSPPITPAPKALAQEHRVTLGAQALAFFDQLIVLSAGQTQLFLGFGRHSRQLQRFFVPIQVIEQLAGQVAGINFVVLTPLPSLLSTIRRTDVAKHPCSLELSIKRVP